MIEPSLFCGALELGVFPGHDASSQDEPHSFLSREWFEKKPEGLRGRCTQTTKMEMKQWQMMMCHILKEFCQRTCYVSKVNCGFPVMCDRSCIFFSLS